MIKVSFHKPQLIVQDGELCECMRVYAFATMFNYKPKIRGIWTSKNEVSLVRESNIKSIEHVKPSEL